MTEAFTAFMSGGFDLNLLVLDFPRGDRCSDADWWPTIRAFRSALAASEARGAVVASLPENMPETCATDLLADGIAPLSGIAEAIDATEAAALIGEAWRRPFTSPSWGGRTKGPGGGTRTIQNSPTPTLRVDPPHKGEGNPNALSEAAAKTLLAAAGLAVPEGSRAANADETVATARALGFPVAVKALGIAHKSEHGAVRLGLRDEDAVRAAAAGLLPLGNGLLVERMIEGAVAELIVGIVRDPLFGPVMTLGAGGVQAELLADCVTLLLPSSREEIEAALRTLRLFPLLEGYRGRPRADLAAAIEAIEAIAGFALDRSGEIEELDVNPLVVCGEGQGAWIADALLVARVDAAVASLSREAVGASAAG